MLAAPHFMVVFTLPGVLRPLAKANPELVYDALMKASADTLADLARLKYDARVGVTTVLHTWTREMTFHPHVHALVSSVGWATDGSIVRAKHGWLFSRKALARCFRAKFLQRLVELARDGLLDLGRWSIATWSQKANNTAFVVHVEPPLGRDAAGVVRYLARYVYNIAISDSRILAVTNSTVTIAGRNGPVTMDKFEFVRRWSMHVLPKGFRKVRHTGLYAPGNGALLAQAKAALGNAFPPRTVGGEPPDEPAEVPEPWTCDDCGATECVTVDFKSLSDVLALLSRQTPCPAARGPP